MKREVFLNLLTRKISNDLSDTDRLRFKKALLENTEYQELNSAFEKYVQPNQNREANSSLNLEKVWNEIQASENGQIVNAPLKKNRPFPLLWKIAAALLIVLTTGLLFTYISNYDSTPMAEISSGEEKLFITLDDGSSVWLNKHSILRYNEDFGETKRKVVLAGEAFFDVRKDPKVPMVIEAGNLLISVKGTAFNVEAYDASQKVVVELVRGIVEVFDRDNKSNRVELKPSQQLLYANGTEGSYFSVSSFNLESKFELSSHWRQDSLVFRKEKLRNLAIQLENKYEVKIDIRNERLKEKRFSGSFTDESLLEAIEALKLSFPFNYKIKGNQVIIE